MELVRDPGFLDLAENQCSQDSTWSFRSDYLWNQTSDFVDAQCQVYLELPTDKVPGVTKGNETNINHVAIPPLPAVTGGSLNWPSSAAVVDMNSPCRAALWTPITVLNDTATIDIDFMLWASRVLSSQTFIDNSLVPNATLLQYLSDPYGLLQQDTNTFPATEDVTNQIRVDIILPDSDGSFYNRAFSLDPTHLAASFLLPGFGPDNAIPEAGTSSMWEPVHLTTTLNHGEYALRFASAHSVIGTAWGVADVHLVESGGTVPINNTVIPLPWDMIIDNAAQTVGGTLTVSKLIDFHEVLKKNLL